MIVSEGAREMSAAHAELGGFRRVHELAADGPTNPSSMRQILHDALSLRCGLLNAYRSGPAHVIGEPHTWIRGFGY